MVGATMTSKGQVSISKEVREVLGLRPGTVISFRRQADGGYLLTTDTPGIAGLQAWFRYSGPVRTIEDMNETVLLAGDQVDSRH